MQGSRYKKLRLQLSEGAQREKLMGDPTKEVAVSFPDWKRRKAGRGGVFTGIRDWQDYLGNN